MATSLKLLITLLFIVSVQGSNGQRCSTSSIQVNTINTGATVGRGDTVFEVEVKNTCPCGVRNLRLDGAGFATTVEVDPTLFRPDDGGVYLVNDGGRIASMATVSFRYAWDHFFQMAPRSLEDDQC